MAGQGAIDVNRPVAARRWRRRLGLEKWGGGQRRRAEGDEECPRGGGVIGSTG